jgi:hypothetical protein
MGSIARITLVFSLLATVLAMAQPESDAPLEEPDVRLVYESDTRAYYRPCG